MSMNIKTIEDVCFERAFLLIERGLAHAGTDIFKLTNTLINLEKEKELKNSLTDKTIDYNDEIISIEEMGELETIDISVSGDNLFYCNNILTKNSFGLPATADFMLGMITTEELEDMNQIMCKQLKNRLGSKQSNKRFIIRVDRAKMRFADAEDSAQEDILDKPIMDNTNFGKEENERGKPKSKFDFSGLR